MATRHKAPTDVHSNADARAKRLKSLREMTGLSRDMIKKRYGIARGTLQNWESARFGGLTEKGARIIIRALKAEGVTCQLQWLLYGVGPEPLFANQALPSSNAPAPEVFDISEAELDDITAELLCFRQNNPDCIDLVVADDGMLPHYRVGDFVAGNRYYRDEINKVVGQVCILQTQEHGMLLRHLKNGDEPGQYHLLATNATGNARQPALYNVDVISAAPVIWLRRPDHIAT